MDDKKKKVDYFEEDQGSKGGQAGNQDSSSDNEYQEGIESDRPLSKENEEDSN